MTGPGRDEGTRFEGLPVDGTRDRGLTLVEVLVAVALIGVALVPMVSAHTYFNRVTTESRRTIIAAGLARRCLSHLKVTVEYDDLDGSTSCSKTYGDFDPPRGDFHYETHVERLVGPESASRVKVIRLKIVFPAAFGENHRTLSCTGGVAPDGSGCDRWDRVALVSPRT